MLKGELRPTLEELRKVRTGALQPGQVRGPLASYVGLGVGRLCDLVAAWIEEDVVDRRGVDATLGFFGLSRMPERLDVIASRMRSQWNAEGLTTRRVEQLIEECLDRAERRAPPLRIEITPRTEQMTIDPFAGPFSPEKVLEVQRVVLWAWADATGPPSEDATALLLYEFEHGLRSRGPELNGDRKRRLRLRRRAWSMLDVALYRREESQALDWLANRSLGPRFDASTPLLTLDGGGALAFALVAPAAADLREALTFVRRAVREGRPWSRELLGLFRDILRQVDRVPRDVSSKTLALAAIEGRRNRDPSGLLAAHQALSEALALADKGRRLRPDELPLISDALRAGHEGAQLAFSIGDDEASWRIFCDTTLLLSLAGDPEREIEPQGWEQNLSRFEASWRRRAARRTSDPNAEFDAAFRLATKSMELVFEDGILPVRWGLNAQSQRVGALVDHVSDLAAIGGDDSARKLARVAQRELEQLTKSWNSFSSTGESAEETIQTQSGLLSAARYEWSLAIVARDTDRVRVQHDLVAELTRAAASGAAVEKLRALEQASGELLGSEYRSDVGLPAKDRGSMWEPP